MKCPHCNSHMDNYQSSSDEKIEVLFYRCTICEALHVSSSKVSAHQLNSALSSSPLFSSNTSQNLTLARV
jgi:DNA-directed RNA polymerase subunit M/transcription elongation factor TFIIS